MNQQPRIRRNGWRWLSLIIFMTTSIVIYPSQIPQATPVPADLRASLLLRTLAYDRNLAERAGEQLVILVLEGSNASDANTMGDNLEAMAGQVNVAGLRVRIVRQRWSSLESLTSAVEANDVSVIYVGAGLENVSNTMVSIARSHQITLIAADGADMPNGCSLGFTVSDNRPLIVIDLEQANQSGMDFRDTVLEVARVL